MPCFLSRWHGASLGGAPGGAFQCWPKWSSKVQPQSWGNTACLSPLLTLGFSIPSPWWWTYSVQPYLLLLTAFLLSRMLYFLLYRSISHLLLKRPLKKFPNHWGHNEETLHMFIFLLGQCDVYVKCMFAHVWAHMCGSTYIWRFEVYIRNLPWLLSTSPLRQSLDWTQNLMIQLVLPVS